MTDTAPPTAPTARRPLQWGFLIGSVLLQSAASAFSKQAGLSSAEATSLIDVVVNPWYGLSLFSMAAQAVFWLMALRAFRLSSAYPMTAVVFLLHVFWAWTIFDESISPANALGLCLIVAGVALVGRETGLEEQRDKP